MVVCVIAYYKAYLIAEALEIEGKKATVLI